MIGIICAMQAEAHVLLNNMENAKTERVSGVDFVYGTVGGLEVTVAVSGVGKVFAALCTQTMILRFSPDFIINTGVAGSLTSRLHCGDIAIATSVVQHDLDTTALGDPLGLVSGINKINFKCDAASVNTLKQIAAEQLSIECVCGVIASGDRFINSKKEKELIKRWFGAVACDMESGAIGQICFVNNIPFCIIRSISDSADSRSHMDYADFVRLAADNAAALLLSYLRGSK